MMSTLTVATTPPAGSPAIHQPTAVTSAIVSTAGTNTA